MESPAAAGEAHEFGAAGAPLYLREAAMDRLDDMELALALEAPSTRRGPELRWLERSHRAPQRLLEALCALLSAVADPGPKSAPGSGFDLYHDLVARHIGSGHAALRIHDPHASAAEPWRVLSYDQLHARCSLRAAAWIERGVKAGAKVCVVLPFGENCVISLLTALRLGACVSLLEPGGPDYLARRLATLGPDYVATEKFYIPRLTSQWSDLEALAAGILGDEETAPRTGIGSYSYAADEPCALLFSPLRRAPELPVPLGAEPAYFGAARDGALALALRPGDSLAAPGFDSLQHQPALLFAALIMGATFVQIDEAQVIREPALIRELPLRSLGLSAPVREALLEAPASPRPGWAHLFKNPEEPCDWEAWRDFVELLELGDVALSNLLFEAASGGCLLSSPRRPARQQLARLMDVTPAAGRAWTLLDFSGSDQPAVGEVGVFAPLAGVRELGDEGTPADPRYLVLGRRRGIEYMYGGTTEPRRCGRVYPAQEVLDALADCPFLHAASVVAVPAGGVALAYRFVLLGFTGGEPELDFAKLRQAREDELRRVLATRLSDDHLPDHIELFPCYARVRDGEVDHRWCQEQYLGGVLFRKLRSPVFRRLTELRRALA